MQEYPGCNWGVACGPLSGVFVLDVDGDEGQAAIRSLSERHGYDWMETLRVKTARGMHLYFCYPEGTAIRNSTSKLLYTSDAADEEDSVDLGGRRIIKK